MIVLMDMEAVNRRQPVRQMQHRLPLQNKFLHMCTIDEEIYLWPLIDI